MNRRAARRPITPHSNPRLTPWRPGEFALSEAERALPGSAAAAYFANLAILRAMYNGRASHE